MDQFFNTILPSMNATDFLFFLPEIKAAKLEPTVQTICSRN